MKSIISILLSLVTLFPAAARIVLCDDNCKVEFSATTENEPRFMEHTDFAPEQTVAVLPIAHRNTTAWHVAVNGVMAGCKPEYMPLLIAITEALGAPEFRRTLASTHG